MHPFPAGIFAKGSPKCLLKRKDLLWQMSSDPLGSNLISFQHWHYLLLQLKEHFKFLQMRILDIFNDSYHLLMTDDKVHFGNCSFKEGTEWNLQKSESFFCGKKTVMCSYIRPRNNVVCLLLLNQLCDSSYYDCLIMFYNLVIYLDYYILFNKSWLYVFIGMFIWCERQEEELQASQQSGKRYLSPQKKWCMGANSC